MVLESFQNSDKIGLIKEIRALLPGILLKEVMDLMARVPIVLVSKVDQETAENVEARVEAQGGVARIQLEEPDAS